MIDVLVQLEEVVGGEGDGALVAFDVLAGMGGLDVSLQGDLGKEALGTEGATFASGNLEETFSLLLVLLRDHSFSRQKIITVVNVSSLRLLLTLRRLLLFQADLPFPTDPLGAT